MICTNEKINKHVTYSFAGSYFVPCSEAGRGCVLGSMIYGCAYWSTDVDKSKKIPSGFRDSKTLNEDGKSVCLFLVYDNRRMFELFDSYLSLFSRWL